MPNELLLTNNGIGLESNITEVNNNTTIKEDRVLGTKIDGVQYEFSLAETDITNATNISCNEDATAIIEDNKLKISNMHENTVCKINDTLKSTVDTSDESRNNIMMIKDEVTSSDCSISENKVIELDLNGKKISSPGIVIYVRAGNLKIKGDGVISTTGADLENGAIKIWGDGGSKLSIEGNECNSTNINEYNSGLLIYANNTNAIADYGLRQNDGIDASIDINGGCYVSEAKNAIRSYGQTNLTINNAKTVSKGNGIIVSDNSSLVIYDGSFTSLEESVIVTNVNSNTKIYGGSFVSRDYGAILHINGNMYLYGGTYSIQNNEHSIINSNNGNLYVSGGTYNGFFNISPNGSNEGSLNYICGGTFVFAGSNITPNDPVGSLKYTSNVVWSGKTSPTIGGSYPNTILKDDSITCPVF